MKVGDTVRIKDEQHTRLLKLAGKTGTVEAIDEPQDGVVVRVEGVSEPLKIWTSNVEPVTVEGGGDE